MQADLMIITFKWMKLKLVAIDKADYQDLTSHKGRTKLLTLLST